MSREEALNDWLPIIRQMVNGTEVYTEALDMAIKALKQQPTDAVDRAMIKEYLYSLGMGIKVTATDAVDRQTALEAFGLSEKSRKYGGDHSGYDTLMKYEIQDILEDLPSVTPQQKMGRWINKASGSLIDRYVCSACDKEPCQKKYRNTWGWDFTRYCPNCGAKMSEIPTGAEGSDKV